MVHLIQLYLKYYCVLQENLCNVSKQWEKILKLALKLFYFAG